MRRLNFQSLSAINPLYIEFKSATDYIHSIRKINEDKDNRIEPYEPSMFIFTYFSFNTLYNIDWIATRDNGYKNIIFNEATGERTRINNYLYFIWK